MNKDYHSWSSTIKQILWRLFQQDNSHYFRVQFLNTCKHNLLHSLTAYLLCFHYEDRHQVGAADTTVSHKQTDHHSHRTEVCAGETTLTKALLNRSWLNLISSINTIFWLQINNQCDRKAQIMIIYTTSTPTQLFCLFFYITTQKFSALTTWCVSWF